MHRETFVRCSEPGCGAPATHKIAAPWSDGRFTELKTYGFSCLEHIGDVLRNAETHWLKYEPVQDEAVYEIGIYKAVPGPASHQWVRDPDIEEIFLS